MCRRAHGDELAGGTQAETIAVHVQRLDYGADMKLSARNQIPARVTGITHGEAIANVVLDAGGVRLVASITVEAVRELGLKEGSEVTAVVKASDVMLVTSG